MSIITTVTKLDFNDYTLAEIIQRNFKTDEFDIISSSENGKHYIVEIFKGKVVKYHQVNLAFYDDYRPGLEITVYDNGTINKVSISCEDENSKCIIDATYETVKAYNEHVAYEKRKEYVQRKLRIRRNFINDAAGIGFTYHDMKRLHQTMDNDNYVEAVKLLKSFKQEKLRSEFRKSLAAQIYNWMTDPEPLFLKPLSLKQMSFLQPYKPYYN